MLGMYEHNFIQLQWHIKLKINVLKCTVHNLTKPTMFNKFYWCAPQLQG